MQSTLITQIGPHRDCRAIGSRRGSVGSQPDRERVHEELIGGRLQGRACFCDYDGKLSAQEALGEEIAEGEVEAVVEVAPIRALRKCRL